MPLLGLWYATTAATLPVFGYLCIQTAASLFPLSGWFSGVVSLFLFAVAGLSFLVSFRMFARMSSRFRRAIYDPLQTLYQKLIPRVRLR
jgi:hypothetical protein